MKIKKLILAVFALIIFSSAALADSPLTSTDFAATYADVPIVAAAGAANGLLTDKLMDYLTDKKNPVDVKMAVINKLSWDIDGKTNSQIFWQYVMKKYKYADEAEFLKKGNGDDLLAMAYLKALDNYFDVSGAVTYAAAALEKNGKSRTYNLIAGLIKAQTMMEGNWCEVYQITDRVRKNDGLKDDLKPAAVKIIYEYMDEYQDSCK